MGDVLWWGLIAAGYVLPTSLIVVLVRAAKDNIDFYGDEHD